MGDALNPRQATFVREYLVDLNATQAAIRAGYSERTANEQGARLLAHVSVSAAIKAGQDKRAERTDITADYVLRTIHETIERCRQVQPVLDRKGEQVYVDTPEGKLVPAFIFDAKNVLKGCELLGKHLGIYVERHEHTGKDGAPIETVELTDMEAARRIAFLFAKATHAEKRSIQ